MQFVVSGEITEIDRYRSFIESCLKHFDQVKVGSNWKHPAQVIRARDGIGYFSREVLENATAPSSEWEFIVVCEDDEFGLWFKLKYA